MVPDWKPACSLRHLRNRAQMLDKIRQYFAEQGVLEVETPLLGHAIGTDPNLDFFSTEYLLPPQKQRLYLQTSPEFAMKRLLASGSGSIFQICKAFRNGEAGRLHNPEFTLLEWYRVGFDLSRLMDEIAELLLLLLDQQVPIHETRRLTYSDVFQRYTGLDALHFAHSRYSGCAASHNLPEAEQLCGQNHAAWLDFLFSHIVQPQLTGAYLYLIYDYPACQPGLSRLRADNALVAERVEVFINGIELGNGYYELADVIEQERRFHNEIQLRKTQRKPAVTVDGRFISALTSGLPECSGMAIGLDRLLMLATGSGTLADVLAFPISRA